MRLLVMAFVEDLIFLFIFFIVYDFMLLFFSYINIYIVSCH